jgi:hypothetical protein
MKTSRNCSRIFLLIVASATLVGCANNPIIGIESGDKGTYFKRLSVRCVVGKSSALDLTDVSLSHEQVHPGDILAHTVVLERCVKDEDAGASGLSVKVTRQIMVGTDAVASNTEDVSAQIVRNGIWEVKSQINIGNNPPGRYAIRTTVDAGGRKMVRVNPFNIVR